IFVGAFMFLEREKYILLNGFDEDFFMYGEDIDLSYRAIKKGLKNYYFADTTIIHYKGESTGKDSVYLKRFYSAMQIFYKKHFKTNSVIDLLITFGIRLFLILNYFRKKTTTIIIPTAYYLISNDDDLKLKIEKSISEKITLVTDYKNFEFPKQKGIEVILDNSYLSNIEIIEFMQNY